MFFNLVKKLVTKKAKIIDDVWNDDENLKLYTDANLRISKERAYTIQSFLKYTQFMDGELAELGVYKGSTAYILSDFLYKNNINKKLYLFDTFEGTPKETVNDNLNREGLYSDTSIEYVRNYLSKFSFITYIKGYIPETLAEISDKKFSFVHLHLNLYQSNKDSMEFLYTRVSNGGIILIEDYGLVSCKGVKKAIDEFCNNQKINVVHLTTGQGVIIKVDK
jgi:O-methyltransferase